MVLSPSSPGVVGSPELAERAADLADRAACAEGFADGRKEVAGAGGGLADEGEGARGVLGVAFGAHAREAVALALLAGRIDAMELDARVGFLAELVDADDDLPVRLDGGLEAVGGFLDLALNKAGFDRGNSAAELVDAGDQLGRTLLEIRGERLDVLGAAERVGRIGRAGLVHQDLLGAQRARRRVLARKRERLVEAVRVDRLRAAADG